MLENFIKFLSRKIFFQWNPPTSQALILSCDFTFWHRARKFNPIIHLFKVSVIFQHIAVLRVLSL